MALGRLMSGVLNPMQVDGAESITATEAGAAAAEATAIALRQNFNALAVFSPSVITDANGHAEVKVKLPDSLTRYRVMAVTVSGGKVVRLGRVSITARMPLMVRPSAPRFLNFGDKFELPVVVQNQTDLPMDVEVGVRASNAELTSGGGRRVTVAGERPCGSAVSCQCGEGRKARFNIGWCQGSIRMPHRWSCRCGRLRLPKRLRRMERLTRGQSCSRSRPHRIPSRSLAAGNHDVVHAVAGTDRCGVVPDGLSVRVLEQISSRVAAVAALKDVLTAFTAKDLPTPDEMKAAVGRDIKRLQGCRMTTEVWVLAAWRTVVAVPEYSRCSRAGDGKGEGL